MKTYEFLFRVVGTGETEEEALEEAVRVIEMGMEPCETVLIDTDDVEEPVVISTKKG